MHVPSMHSPVRPPRAHQLRSLSASVHAVARGMWRGGGGTGSLADGSRADAALIAVLCAAGVGLALAAAVLVPALCGVALALGVAASVAAEGDSMATGVLATPSPDTGRTVSLAQLATTDSHSPPPTRRRRMCANPNTAACSFH